MSPSRRTRRRRRQSPLESFRSFVAEQIGDQADDVWGTLCVLIGILLGLGIYFDAMGIAGSGVRRAAATLFGAGQYLLPVAFGGLGVAFYARRDDPDSPVSPRRIGIACTLLVFAVTGFGHLWGGQPSSGSTPEDIRGAGGFLGILLGGGLYQFVGAIGSTMVLLAFVVLGIVLAGNLSIGGLVSSAREWVEERRASRSDEFAEEDEDTRVIDLDTGEVYEDDDTEEYEEVYELDEDEDYDEEVEDEEEVEEGPLPIHTHADKPAKPEKTEQITMGLGPLAHPTKWKLPSTGLLQRSKTVSIDRRMVEAGGRTLEAALASHGVETRLVGMTVGPSITRYELELGPGVKVSRVTNLNKDIAYAMASPDVRILAPIPGKSAIGIEVPNQSRALVTIGDILSSDEAMRATHPLEVALGRDIAGRPILVNLATMPHLLIAGATGAGKSSCINSLISSILVRNTPEQVRMILVDPKRVELGQYNGLPHLLTQVVTNPKKAANALAWAVQEMDRRYTLLYEIGVRDITGYNMAYDRGDLTKDEDSTYERLPFVLVVVDELNDLMMVAPRDVEAAVMRIAQMARAVGIHLVIATQRPSVNVITGVIKANIPSRMAFAVSSLADSRVILDQPGAERLIGKGDMLLLEASSSIPRRIQGAWVTEDEVRKVVSFWKRQGGTNYVEGVEGTDDGKGGSSGVTGGGDEDDELLEQAMELVVRSGLGSTSMLQRKLRVGFARAGRLMDLLEERGVVGPSEGSKARAVLMSKEELEEIKTNS